MSWAALEIGDLVDVVAPGSACTRLELENGVRFLESWGLRARVPKEIFGRDAICANSDEIRMKQLKEALLSEDSKAVWCVRGGYGAIRLVPELAKLRKPRHSKLFVGYSDITTIHLFLNQAWRWPTLHAPMLDRLGRGVTSPKYLREIKQVVFGTEKQIHFTGLVPMNNLARVKKSIHGRVSGGNLVTLQSAVGTKAPWLTQGQILFLEEIAERGYRLDRMFTQLKQNGCFKYARAVVLGDFIGGEEKDGRTQVPQVLKKFAEELGIPVLKGIKAGHGTIQRPVPFATESVLKTGARGVLSCDTGCA